MKKKVNLGWAKVTLEFNKNIKPASPKEIKRLKKLRPEKDGFVVTPDGEVIDLLA